MGTRSDIIVQRTDGKWARVYCHWDGYLSHNGKIISEHYNSQELAEALVSLGDISSLGEEIGEKHDFDYGVTLDHEKDKEEYNRLRRMCTFYGRDREETGTEASTFRTLKAATKSDLNEYTYVWTDGAWHWWADGQMKDLGESVAAKADEEE